MSSKIIKQRALWEAARDGQIHYVKKYIKDASSLDLNFKAKNNWTALHCACSRGHNDIASLLLDHGAYIEAASSSNETPLFYACIVAHYLTIKLLLDRGSKVNGTADNDGNTPLHVACLHGCSRQCVEELIAHGANTTCKNKYGQTPLDMAKEKREKFIIELLMNGNKYKGKVAIMTSLEKALRLRNAAREGQIEFVKMFLMDDTLDVNVKDFDNWTSLHQACYNGHRDIAELLLDYGADIEAVTSYFLTPLKLACVKGHASTTKLLLDRGSDVNAASCDYGNTALHNACEGGHSNCVKELLAHGADRTIKNKDGNTPLDVTKEEGITNLMNENRTKNQVKASKEYTKKSTLDEVSCVESTAEERRLSKKVKSIIDRRFESLRRDISASQEKEENQIIPKLTKDLESKVETIVAWRCEEIRNNLFVSKRTKMKQTLDKMTSELVGNFNAELEKGVTNLSTTVEQLSEKVCTIETRLECIL